MSANHSSSENPGPSQDSAASSTGHGSSPGTAGAPRSGRSEPRDTAPEPAQRERRSRRRGTLITGSAGGAAVLAIGAMVLAMSLGGEDPYASVGACDELLTEDVLSGAEGMAGAGIEEEQNSFEPSGDGEAVESLECSAVNESDEAAVDVTFSRFDPGTASDGYAAVHEEREQSISELAENYGVDLGQDGAGDESEVTTEEIPAGDGGRAYSIEGIDSVGMPRTSTAVYSIRNLNVHVTYFGGRDLSTNEHIGVVTDISKAVERRIASTTETE
ncbi:hypothetical protein F4561_005380 [Lipingzhangella halophila]|uniref:DUF3558 domain-containing protein n=1 Tax=Lipingzhangella halophila TaxID=1783352 RepID=A0A7W7W669_9ACTN|nr:hypothetical protein [Lipingzhangella halophila]MBB4934560.1 hypothetical protein [Lipingzhangella halophila]